MEVWHNDGVLYVHCNNREPGKVRGETVRLMGESALGGLESVQVVTEINFYSAELADPSTGDVCVKELQALVSLEQNIVESQLL